jgi:hypothetical protein
MSSAIRMRDCSPAIGLDPLIRSPGIKRILDQFLDGAGRAFDHSAGSYAVYGLAGGGDGHGVR